MLIGFFGDWHGNTHYAQRILHRISLNEKMTKPDIYIHVGDFGFFNDNQGKKFVKVVEEELAKQDREMWVVLGNHEDYHLTATYPFDERGLQKVSDHLYIVPRGYAWEWNKVKFGALGGAYSVDRKWRKLNESYWLEEEITEADYLKTMENGPYHVLVTHDTAFLPNEKPSEFVSEADELASAVSRRYVKDVLLNHQVKLNIHGHHHKFYEKEILNGQTHVVGLACDGSPFDKNYYVLDLDLFKLEHEIY